MRNSELERNVMALSKLAMRLNNKREYLCSIYILKYEVAVRILGGMDAKSSIDITRRIKYNKASERDFSSIIEIIDGLL